MRRGALAAGAAQAIGRFTGLARDIAFAAVFGAGHTADAFFAAFRVPNLFRELLAEGTLSNVFVPLFAETEERDGIERAWALANALLGVLLIILGVLTLGIWLFAEPLVLLVAGGFAAHSGKVALAAWLTRLMAPFLAGVSIASLFGGMLNVRGRFFLPALAPAALNVCIIVACLCADAWSEWTGTPAIGAVAVAATLSGLITAGIQLPALRKEGFRLRPVLKRHPALGRVARFVAAALVSVVVVQFNVLVETQLASREGEGPVSWLMLGFRLVQIPMSLVAGSVAVAALARISVQLAQSDRSGARLTLSEALETTNVLVIPAAVGLYLLADPLVALCFERGAFTATDTAATASILRGYAFAVVGICAYRVLLPTFFALGDPYFPMRISLVVMALKIPAALALMVPFGLMGLPLSHALTVSLEVAVFTVVLGRRLDGWTQGFWSQHARMALAAVGMGFGVWALDATLPEFGSLRVLFLCAAGAATYGILATALRIRALGPLFERLRRKDPR